MNLFPNEKAAVDEAKSMILSGHVHVRNRLMLTELVKCVQRLVEGSVKPPAWEPLERGTGRPFSPEQEARNVAELRKTDPAMTAEKMYAELDRGELWINKVYTVAVYHNGADGAGGEFIHLSIKRNDREPLHDWRDLQRIKSQLCGDEAEGVELYPAESRVVDMANQYHIWVFTKLKLKFGFKTDGKAQKMTAEESAGLGSKQRAGA